MHGLESVGMAAWPQAALNSFIYKKDRLYNTNIIITILLLINEFLV